MERLTFNNLGQWSLQKSVGSKLKTAALVAGLHVAAGTVGHHVSKIKQEIEQQKEKKRIADYNKEQASRPEELRVSQPVPMG